MATIEISSRLDHFHMIDAIRQVKDESIAAIACFDHAPAFAGLEAMAQLAALHVRYRIDFRRHAFLLKVVHCQGLPRSVLDGRYLFEARLESHSLNAFRYGVTAEGDAEDPISSELLIGVRDYDEQFQGNHLQGHYQKMFAGLCAGIS